jgi:hypothetical protein
LIINVIIQTLIQYGALQSHYLLVQKVVRLNFLELELSKGRGYFGELDLAQTAVGETLGEMGNKLTESLILPPNDVLHVADVELSLHALLHGGDLVAETDPLFLLGHRKLPDLQLQQLSFRQDSGHKVKVFLALTPPGLCRFVLWLSSGLYNIFLNMGLWHFRYIFPNLPGRLLHAKLICEDFCNL